MKEYTTTRDIELRLMELDKMESQILFSGTYLSAEDKEMLNDIRKEMLTLKLKLKERQDKHGVRT